MTTGTFWQWQKQKSHRLFTYGALIFAIVIKTAETLSKLLPTMSLADSQVFTKYSLLTNYVIQIVICLVFLHIFNSLRSAAEQSTFKHFADKAKWLRRIIQAFAVCMILFYAIRSAIMAEAIYKHLTLPLHEPTWMRAVFDLINCCQTVIQVCLYVILVELHEDTAWDPWKATLFPFCGMALICVADLFLIFQLPAANQSPAHFYLMLTNQMIGATALAMMIGRLDSVNLRLPTVMLIFLYLYALVQVMYAFVESKATKISAPIGVSGLSVVYYVALIGKTFMFFAFYWLLDTDALTNYVSANRPLPASPKPRARSQRRQAPTPQVVSSTGSTAPGVTGS